MQNALATDCLEIISRFASAFRRTGRHQGCSSWKSREAKAGQSLPGDLFGAGLGLWPSASRGVSLRFGSLDGVQPGTGRPEVRGVIEFVFTR